MTVDVFRGTADCVVSERERERRRDVLGDKRGMLRCMHLTGAVRVTIGWTRGSDWET